MKACLQRRIPDGVDIPLNCVQVSGQGDVIWNYYWILWKYYGHVVLRVRVSLVGDMGEIVAK